MPSPKPALRKSKPHRAKSANPVVASGNNWKRKTSTDGVTVLQAPGLAALPWLVHGFSTSSGGVSTLGNEKVLNLGFTDWDRAENVRVNRHRFQSALDARKLSLVALKQFHSDVVCDFSDAPKEACSADASISNTPGLLLGIQTADCVPILLVDPVKRAIAAVHAGWRGTLKRIVEKTVGRMEMQYGSRPKDLLAAIGPAIGGCCYEVGVEVAASFQSQFPQATEWFDELRTGDEPNPLQWLNQFPPGHQPPPKSVRLDLRKANRAQLLAVDLDAKNIFVSDLCTSCHPELLFSYRKDGKESGRMMSAIGIATK